MYDDSIIVMPANKLLEAIDKMLDRKLSALAPSLKEYPEWITKGQVMDLLGYSSPSSIDNLVRDGKRCPDGIIRYIKRRYRDRKPMYSYSSVVRLRNKLLIK